MSHTHGHDPHHSGHGVFDDERVALMIGAEGESAGPLTAEAIERATAALRGGRDDVRRVADLGCGPGVEACALATAFPAALIVALDGSPAMRAAAQRRVGEAGLSARVEVGAIDLDGDLSSLGAFDLVWTAQALHHLRDEAATLARVAALLRPGGVLCVLERLDPAELVASDDLGRPGLWERVAGAQAAWHADRSASAPATGLEGYAALVGEAGFGVVDSGPLRSVATLEGSPGAAPLVARYVQGALRNLTDRLDPADIEALRALDGGGSARVSHLEVRQSRTLVIGRAPGA
ncbi:MAG: class I SAM-dependent methyltransferase [Thermoleophilia bacterium]|nr:class I SAM-dependent methyltransferase [Thermoleophilia bacterium]